MHGADWEAFFKWPSPVLARLLFAPKLILACVAAALAIALTLAVLSLPGAVAVGLALLLSKGWGGELPGLVGFALGLAAFMAMVGIFSVLDSGDSL